MNTCETIRELFVEALYNELQGENARRLETHLKDCPACAAELAAMRSTLKIMDGRVRPEPETAFWANFDAKLQARIKESAMPEARPETKIVPFRRRIPQWAWQAAAALILVGLGVVIGRSYLKVEPPVQTVRKTQPAAPVHTVSADVETKRFLERSEVLLLGVVNTDPSNEEVYSSDIEHQRKVSRDLIQEASLIKGKLSDPRQRRLRELVSDLEVILLQIANLEAEQDQPEIEVLKNGVDRKGLLLKINLEQMRLSSPKVAKPESAKKADGPAI